MVLKESELNEFFSLYVVYIKEFLFGEVIFTLKGSYNSDLNKWPFAEFQPSSFKTKEMLTPFSVTLLISANLAKN